jgi:hypothetical protein
MARGYNRESAKSANKCDVYDIVSSFIKLVGGHDRAPAGLRCASRCNVKASF